MTSALSKRQQARNEKALQDLVHNVSGNNLCADCHARNPGLSKTSLYSTHLTWLLTRLASQLGHHGVYETTSPTPLSDRFSY